MESLDKIWWVIPVFLISHNLSTRAYVRLVWFFYTRTCCLFRSVKNTPHPCRDCRQHGNPRVILPVPRASLPALPAVAPCFDECFAPVYVTFDTQTQFSFLSLPGSAIWLLKSQHWCVSSRLRSETPVSRCSPSLPGHSLPCAHNPASRTWAVSHGHVDWGHLRKYSEIKEIS